MLDTLLAEAMGLAQPLNIRAAIAKHRAELESFGTVHAVCEPYTTGNGTVKETTAYYLNEEQALLVVSLSRTEAGKKLRAELIRVFVAWRRGELAKATPNFGNPAEAARAWALGWSGAERPQRGP